MSDLKKWFALWENKKGDKRWLSGYCGDLVVQVWPNGFKENDKQPDYVVYVSEKKKKEKDGAGAPAPKKKEEADPDLPF